MPVAAIIPKDRREWLTHVGHARNEAKDPSWTRRKSDVFSDAEVDALGMYGEAAVAEYLGLDVDETITRHGDAGYDLMWKGLRVAVKFNHRWRGYLMVEARAGDKVSAGKLGDLTADVIVLAHGKCAPPGRCDCRTPGGIVVALGGWLTFAEFLKRMTVRDLGLGDRYICTIDQLRPMHELWEMWRGTQEWAAEYAAALEWGDADG